MQRTGRTRRSLLAVLGAAVMVPAFMSGSALGDGAQKVPLHRIGTPCTPAPMMEDANKSFAVINVTNGVVTEVSLKNADPSTTYTVYLVQMAGSLTECQDPDGYIVTNAQGNGNTHIYEAIISDTWFVQVVPDCNGQAVPPCNPNPAAIQTSELATFLS
jgi:hypothetical protein